MKKIKTFFGYAAMVFFAVLAAVNYTVFVFPNDFAPAGIDGICTMIQYVLDVNMGYLALVVNVPLLIAGYFLLNREFIVKTVIYTLSFSAALIVLRWFDLSLFLYHTDTGTSTVLAPIVAGILRGLLYVVTLKCNGSAGGVDVIAALIHKFRPYYNLMSIIFVLNLLVALIAYFVYGFDLEPVICSIIYSLLSSTVSRSVQASRDETVKFEIITSYPNEICNAIAQQLHQTATILDAKGAYSGSDKKMVICVTNKQKVPQLEAIMKTFPDAVAFESIVIHSAHGVFPR